MSTISIIGSGGMAAAIGGLAARAGHTVEVMSRNAAKARALAQYMDSPCVASGVFTGGFRIGLQTIYPAFSASVDAGPDDIRSQRPHYFDGV